MNPKTLICQIPIAMRMLCVYVCVCVRVLLIIAYVIQKENVTCTNRAAFQTNVIIIWTATLEIVIN